MDQSPEGNILLVGEGDFSFTVAMTNKIPTGCQGHILATSLETPQSIKKHVTAEHISVLKQKGVEVRLSTDATQLHTDPFFRDKTFSRIIFNFPHAGGKSNLKKNRKLLNDFFASACHVLEPKGQIMVTLCKGQGGTPADQPIRKWCDSWQVVSMAANSGLILVKTLPFCDEAFTVYTSTGFRSQDKRFHTERAVTHVFERAERVTIPDYIAEITVRIGGHLFKCPAYIYHKLKHLRMINQQKQHVIQRFYRSVVSRLNKFLKMDHSVVPDVIINYEKLQTFVFARPVHLDSVDNVYTLKVNDNKTMPAEGFVDVIHVCRNETGDKDVKMTECYLSGSFVDCLENLPGAFQEKGYFVICGAMFHKVPISPLNIPAFFSVFISSPVPDDLLLRSCDTSRMSDSIHMQSANQTDKLNDSLSVEEFGINFHMLISKTLQLLQAMVSDPDKVNITVSEERVTREYPYGTLYTVGTVIGKVSLDGQQTMSKMGQVYLTELKQPCSTKSWKVMVEINFCTLICLNLGIPSEKYLWSQDYRVIEELDRVMQLFESGEHVKNFSEENIEDKMKTENGRLAENDKAPDLEHNSKEEIQLEKKSNTHADYSHAISSTNDGQSKDLNEKLYSISLGPRSESTFKASSLYPLTSVHDISFWENEDLLFDESEFHMIIQSVAVDEVISVELIDQFTEPTTGKRSRCYRLTFRSVDKCLSYDCSWKLQSLIRLEVEKYMKIGLR